MVVLEWISKFILIIFFLVVIVKLIKSVRIVPQRYAYLVERLGRYHTTLNSGFHILIPFFDRVAFILDLKEETIEVPPQECFTKDEVKVMVDGVIYISVIDPVKAAYGIVNYRQAAMLLAQTTTRSVMGQIPLDQSFEERETISAKVVETLEQTGSEWGMRVHRYEIKNIEPPVTVHQSMEKQVTAERDRKAIFSRAQGDAQSRINRSEGVRNEMVNRSQGEKQRRINEAQGKASEIRALAEATAVSIEKVAQVINMHGGKEAVQLQLVEQMINNLGELADGETRVLLPADLTNLDALLEKLGLQTSAR